MTGRLEQYEAIIGPGAVQEILLLGRRLQGALVRHINSTATGGGVAEILKGLVPLMEEVGLRVRWDLIRGSPAFFGVTKKIHNALHGRADALTEEEIAIYLETTRQNLETLDLSGDFLFIHDPQPAGLVQARRQDGARWIWRCHIDVSHPNPSVWNFLAGFVHRYDCVVFSAPQFVQPVPIRQFLMAPSIDPLSMKNRDLPPETVHRVLQKYGIPRDKPIITQISRFDRLKDPVGVIEAFRMVRRTLPCRLVLAGGGASDDPEGDLVYAEVLTRAGNDPDIHILLLPEGADLEVNALQRASDIIVQKSLAEGFALTVTEALWKAKPVVASAVGGILLQVRHGYTGLLTRTVEGTAFAIRELLRNPHFARWLGENGREHVLRHFLLPRQLRDYLLLMYTLRERRDEALVHRIPPLNAGAGGSEGNRRGTAGGGT